MSGPVRTPASSTALPLAMTQGDPSGIGVEIAIKAWLARTPASAPWFLLADPAHVARVAAELAPDPAV